MKTKISDILAVNGGSSSIKFALFRTEKGSLKQTCKGSINQIGQTDPVFRVKTLTEADSFSQTVQAHDYKTATKILLDWLEKSGRCEQLTAIGYRIVQGGQKYKRTQLITGEMIEELRRLSPIDPVHLPQEILVIEAFQQKFPEVPQVACFDSAFHCDLPRVASLLPIPRRFEALGVRRYGFHGLSCQYLMEELSRISGEKNANGKVILAHLGSGASLAAVLDGKSIDTSMSFTPASGLPMSTRSGDLDPGLVGYLARTEGLSAKSFNKMVNFE